MHRIGDRRIACRSSSAMIRGIVTAGGVGLIPLAPGTFGSIVAIPLAWLLHMVGGIWLVVIATVAIFAIGLWASAIYLQGRKEDPSEVVIDEVVGQMIALWPLSWGLTIAGTDAHVFPWPGWLGAFLAFRFFDILKPPPIRWVDRPGAFGVMMDDVVAGLFAGAAVFITARIAHGGL